jgi:hypothetical protein
MAEPTGVGLKIGGMTGVVWANDNVDALHGHFVAYGFPAAVSFLDRKARIFVKLSHGSPWCFLLWLFFYGW